ncbi:unnamed protein product, partial [Laminaria digitata]
VLHGTSPFHLYIRNNSMFSSGSDRSPSPRQDREYIRGLSKGTSTLGDDLDSSVGPVMSPVLRAQFVSSSSSLGEGPPLPAPASAAGYGHGHGPETPSAPPSGGFSTLEPPKSIPD